MLLEGTKAPQFTLSDQDGNQVSLSDFAGQRVVLYFYPRADTPGCTTQACGVRDHLPEYTEAGAVVLGISPDPVDRVKKFHDKYSLNFTLLADANHEVSEAFGVWGKQSFAGVKYNGVSRSTFIINGEGEIESVIEKAKPKTHDEAVLGLLS